MLVVWAGGSREARGAITLPIIKLHNYIRPEPPIALAVMVGIYTSEIKNFGLFTENHYALSGHNFFAGPVYLRRFVSHRNTFRIRSLHPLREPLASSTPSRASASDTIVCGARPNSASLSASL